MSKMIFKKWKNIIGMYFGTKSYLKSTRNHTTKHALETVQKQVTTPNAVFRIMFWKRL
jgi:hypothetical protein